jgi:hypothetical protein
MDRYPPTTPGWYPNPDDPRSLRYWDGGHWTGRSRPRPPWSSRAELFELSDDDMDRSVEGPVHPHELREPVASGAWSREWLSWRPRQASPTWHRGPGQHSSRLPRPPRIPPPAKLGPARRPLLALVCLVVIAVGVVVSSVAFISPYETNSLVMASDQGATLRFESVANKQCQATLPKYRDVLAWGTDGPSVMAASRQVELLGQRLNAVNTAQELKDPLAQWLLTLRQFTNDQDRYAAVVGPAPRGELQPSLARLSPAAQSSAANLRRQADVAARRADGYSSNLALTACRLEPSVT